MKSEFLANMSHEIRTPMSAILGFGEVLSEEEQLSPKQNDYVQMILNNGKMLLQLINDILDFSKIEAGKLSVETVEFSLSGFLEDEGDAGLQQFGDVRTHQRAVARHQRVGRGKDDSRGPGGIADRVYLHPPSSHLGCQENRDPYGVDEGNEKNGDLLDGSPPHESDQLGKDDEGKRDEVHFDHLRANQCGGIV
jgi:hypothetical protein